MTSHMRQGWSELVSDRKIFLAVLVASLGYFVDLYDLMVFGVVRLPSLKAIGVTDSALLDQGARLLNYQLVGLLLGGFVWGILGDKFGRVRVLFGSILLYSIGNIANAYVTTADQYALCRFVAGVGLSGELGACVTLVSELMSRKHRGLGVTLLATAGMAGGVTAALAGNYLSWVSAYILGGVLGLALLVFRIALSESEIFIIVQNKAGISRGSLRILFRSWASFLKYMYCVLVSAPVWFGSGIVVVFAPEIGRSLGYVGDVKSATAIMAYQGAAVLGDFCMGLLSQFLQSRRKPLIMGLVGVFVCIFLIFNVRLTNDPFGFYVLCSLLGVSFGYVAVFSMTIAEQFGANVRATAAVSIPNVMRGSAVLMLFAFKYLKDHMDVAQAAFIVGTVVMLFALFGVWRLRETYGVPLDYVETRDGDRPL
jgi:MFS transporter, putative metabolite:H+ symporter